jgi:hypothetical protein
MELSDIEIGQKCRCERQDGQYLAIVKFKRGARIAVILGDKIGTDGDPDDPIDRLGTAGLVWVAVECIYPL